MVSLREGKFISRHEHPLPKERALIELLNGSEKLLCVWIPSEELGSGVFECVQGHLKGEKYEVTAESKNFILYRNRYPGWRL